MTAPSSRPRTVTAAFWLWLVAAVLLLVGGLIAAMADIPVFFRGAGVICMLAGAVLSYLTGRIRSRDPRFRRATMALSLVLVVLLALLAAFGVLHILSLLAVIPLIVGAMAMSRPSAAEWFGAAAQEGGTDG